MQDLYLPFLSLELTDRMNNSQMSVTHGRCNAKTTVTLSAAGINALWLVTNYTAWWQRHICVNNALRLLP